MLTGYKYPGVFIPTVCVVRPNGDRVYIVAKDHHSATSEGHFIDRSVPVLTRPEVYRKYTRTRNRRSASVSFRHVNRYMDHWDLEEIA